MNRIISRLSVANAETGQIYSIIGNFLGGEVDQERLGNQTIASRKKYRVMTNRDNFLVANNAYLSF